jgi:hypothetical protein
VPSKTPATPVKRVLKRVPDPVDPIYEDEDDNIKTNGDTPKPTMAAGNGGKIKRGLMEAQKQQESTSSYAQTFRPTEVSQIIKFLEKDNYAAYRQHWIESRNDSGQTVNRPYVCPLTFDEPCPLCEVGDRPSAVTCFNVALVGADGDVLLRSWNVGSRVLNVIKAYASDPKVGPLTKNFYMVNKTGSKQSVQYNISPVRPASLEEDYDTAVPTEAALAALKLYDADIVELTPSKKLRELAAELTADYD